MHRGGGRVQGEVGGRGLTLQEESYICEVGGNIHQAGGGCNTGRGMTLWWGGTLWWGHISGLLSDFLSNPQPSLNTPALFCPNTHADIPHRIRKMDMPVHDWWATKLLQPVWAFEEPLTVWPFSCPLAHWREIGRSNWRTDTFLSSSSFQDPEENLEFPTKRKKTTSFSFFSMVSLFGRVCGTSGHL